MQLVDYELGEHVLNAMDLSIPQRNYSTIYSIDALVNQKILFEKLGITELFNKRVVCAGNKDYRVLKLTDEKYSGYTNFSSNCCGYDAVFTSIKNIPLIRLFGDCPQLMVAGKNTVGIIHAGRDTLDNRILYKFFESYLQAEDVKDCRIAFSPYIHTAHFTHTYIDLQRKDIGDSITKIGQKYTIDLKKIILKDLKNIGILQENIFDKDIDTYELSKKSSYAQGYETSHRYAVHKEGRGAVLIMLR